MVAAARIVAKYLDPSDKDGSAKVPDRTRGRALLLFRLYQQGMLASLAPPNAPTIDILVMAPDESVIATLQVKTRSRGSEAGWVMTRKQEDFAQPHSYYALVDLDPDRPVTYIIPSDVIAKVIRASHRAWLAVPGRNGQPRKHNEVRVLRQKYSPELTDFPAGWLDQYKERWDLITASVRP